MKRFKLCLGVVAAALALACGGEDETRISAEEAERTLAELQAELDALEALEVFEAAPAVPEAVKAAAAAEPQAFTVSFHPDPPVPGEALRAQVRMERGSARPPLTYTWSVAGHRTVEESGAITLPALRKNDRIEVSVEPSSGGGEAVSASTMVPNSRPKVLEMTLDLRDKPEGEVWEVHAWGHDADGDSLEYEYGWILNGKRSEHEGTTFPASELARGDTLRVQVVANDGEESSEVALSGTAEVANAAPDFVSKPPHLDASGIYRYEAKAVDPDGDRRLKFELVEGPEGMTIDSRSGELTWKPTTEQAGRHPVEIAVTDKLKGRSTQSWIIPVVLIEGFETSPAARP